MQGELGPILCDKRNLPSDFSFYFVLLARTNRRIPFIEVYWSDLRRVSPILKSVRTTWRGQNI